VKSFCANPIPRRRDGSAYPKEPPPPTWPKASGDARARCDAPDGSRGSVGPALANQLDLRFSKIFKFGARYCTSINFDLNNALNSSAVLAVNNSYGSGATWQAPLNIIDARLMRFSFQLDF